MDVPEKQRVPLAVVERDANGEFTHTYNWTNYDTVHFGGIGKGETERRGGGGFRRPVNRPAAAAATTISARRRTVSSSRDKHAEDKTTNVNIIMNIVRRRTQRLLAYYVRPRAARNT